MYFSLDWHPDDKVKERQKIESPTLYKLTKKVSEEQSVHNSKTTLQTDMTREMWKMTIPNSALLRELVHLFYSFFDVEVEVPFLAPSLATIKREMANFEIRSLRWKRC